MALRAVFFASGLSGLVYQIVWVREFGHVFGNTVYSASIVVAIFMLGLGAGGYVFGTVADRRYRSSPDSLIRVYALLEVLIGALGLLISLALPHLGGAAAWWSSYRTGADGWHVLSFVSYLWQGALAVVLLVPMTVMMGGTLTLLIRATVRADLRSTGWQVAALYGANTVGAAAGALLTDFVLVPRIGLLATQMVAVALNLGAAAGAFWIARAAARRSTRARKTGSASHVVMPQQTGAPSRVSGGLQWAAVALALSGFAALGMEMLWLRHLAVLLGGFRAVFSLLLTVMLLALGAGAFLGGWLDRRFAQPARTLMIVEALFAATTLLGLAWVDAGTLAARGGAIAPTLGSLSSSSRILTELWFNLRPMLAEVALPALVAGLAFPLSNAIVQSAEASVGRRAGILYAANTLGAVLGSLVTGYWLLPRAGMQASAALLAGIAALAIAPLYLAQERRNRGFAPAASAGLAATALAIWVTLPADFIVQRALGPRQGSEKVVALSEGVTELLAVVERPERGRGLLTNGHAMSSTALLDQRYMRALAHIPLLSMDRQSRVLVIGFGVGNTAHAATLHTTVTHVDVADLSRHILEHASYFHDATHDVLHNPKVSVFINDGRQHLHMVEPGSYDLITLEPPPIAHAGVAALYSREFYELARSRLAPGGYISQWLPAYQVPAQSSLAMVRAFLDVFPQTVLLSGTQAELLLIGTTAPRIELDPERVATALEREPEVRSDLARIDLGSVQEIAGTFVGSSGTLQRATSGAAPVTDDRPLQEYGVISGLSAGIMGVPSSLVDVTSVAAWCPRCVDKDKPPPDTANLDLYLRLLQQAYVAPVADVTAAAFAAKKRRLLGSAYLGVVVPDSAEVHNLVGLAEMREGCVDDAVREFQQALAKEPRSVNARANLGQIRYDQGASLLESRRYADAAALLREAVDLMPDSPEAQNDLGVALASLGRVVEATEHFRQAVVLAPDFAEARRNLESAQRTSVQ
jgi:predicted membrane-bound spermidine synthase/tetratricopeptide (TPR) repeat protein